MAYNIFGFEIRKRPETPSLSSGTNTDGAYEHEVYGSNGANAYGYYLDLNKKLTNEVDLINKYRSMSHVSEIDYAIQDIVNEAIVIEDGKHPLSIQLIGNNTEIPEQIEVAIQEEFNHILELLDFRNNGHDIFREWYVDGKYNAQIVVDETNLQMGIQEIKKIDTRKIKKVRNIIKQKNNGGADVIVGTEEYFVYNENGINTELNGIRLSPDTIIHATSGLTDEYGNTVSYLHKAIKPANQLRYMEDAALIYTLSRAPSRRVFYIDISDLPKQKADQYMQNIMAKYKNKIVYDSSNGEIKDSRVHTTMLEDYWLPRRSNGRSTEITTLPSENITGQVENISYFQGKLYNALNVPISRLKPDNGFSISRRDMVVTRDEMKFTTFIDKIRNKFNSVFLQALRVQLILKGIIAPEDWNLIKNKLNIVYNKNNYFDEIKNTEMIEGRLELAQSLSQYVGIYYSHNYIRKQVLKQTDDEIIKMENEIAEEMKTMNPRIQQQQQQQG